MNQQFAYVTCGLCRGSGTWEPPRTWNLRESCPACGGQRQVVARLDFGRPVRCRGCGGRGMVTVMNYGLQEVVLCSYCGGTGYER